jgi:transposase
VVTLGELVMILDLARQGLSVSAIARRTGLDRKTIRKYVAKGLEPPAYTPRPPRQTLVGPYEPYLRERLQAFPELSGRRLLRDIRALGYQGGYTVLKDFLRTVRPKPQVQFERRFETPPGKQAQVDFAFFKTVFTDQPEVERIVWLFSIVLGHSRLMWARFVARQDLPTVLRCHIAAFEAFGGVPEQILYDRMKTAVLGEVEDPDQPARGIAYNAKLLDLAAHYGFLPKACKPYRAKTKGKVERPFRYVREDFFLARTFRNLDDLNAQFVQWLDQVANVRLHATTQRVVVEHFAEERGHLKALPTGPFNTVLALERRITRDGMVSVAGNLYSVPDSTRRLIASHPAQEGRGQRRIAPGHRTQLPPSNSLTTREEAKPGSQPRGDTVTPRSLAIYDAIGRRLASQQGAP